MLKNFLIIILTLLFPICCCAKENTEWLVYVYLVGTDLESEGGNATQDIAEMVESKIDNSKNVKILLFAGGTKQWQNDVISPKQAEIYQVENDDIVKLKTFKNLNMGDPSSLVEFLKFGEQNFGAKKKGIIFWDHGGGATGGVGYDEIHQDFLSLPEITSAFSKIYGTVDQPVFELIGFDACLMATFDVAHHLSPWGKYMIASEELEPGIGWYHTQWVEFLEKNPTANGLELGKTIANSYLNACQQEDLEDITLSIIDLKKMNQLSIEYFNVGLEILNDFSESNSPQSVLNRIEKAAQKSEKYGTANGADTIDIGDFVKNLNTKENNFEQIYNETIVYKINGKYRKSSGLSIYYPISKDYKEGFKYVLSNGIPNPIFMLNGMAKGSLNEKEMDKVYDRFTSIYEKIEKNLSSESTSESSQQGSENEETPSGKENQSLFANIISGININNMPTVNTSLEKLGELPITFDKDNNSMITVPKEILPNIAKVEMYLTVIAMPEGDEDGAIVLVGSDNTVTEDLEKGTYTEQFDNTWPMLDGKYILPIQLVDQSDDFSRYDCLVKVNGIKANMEIIYDNESQKFKILSVTKMGNDGVPSRVNIKLKDGDKITTIFESMPIRANSEEDDDNDDFEEFDYETFEYKKSMKITEEDLGTDVTYGLMFQLTSLNGETASSTMSIVKSENDELVVYTLDEYLESFEEDEEDDNKSDDE